MQFRSFLYRQKQRYSYHTTKNDFEKKVAEINRFQELITYDHTHFKVKEYDLNFRRDNHKFIVDKFGVFLNLSENSKGCFIVDNDEVFFLIKRLKLRVQTAEELFIINEVYFEECYNFVMKDDEVVVIDIGMNVGFASLYFSTKPEVKRIYAFEPFKNTYNDALINLQFNPEFKNKINPYNFGWSNVTDKLEVTYSGENRGRNRTAKGLISKGVKTSVELYNGAEQLLNIVKENKDHVIVIKMDCEGAEFDIFDSLYSHKLPEQIIGIMLEWHFAAPDKIQNYLSQNDFKLVNTILGVNSGLIYAFR